MPVIDTSAIASASSTGISATATDRTPNNEMTNEGFTKLMLATLQNQTIDNAMDSSQMLQQTSQLSQMESMNKMTSAITSMFAQSTLTSANSLIGREVSWIDANGAQHTDTVSSVRLENGTPILQTEGRLAFVTEQITQVAQPTAATAA